MRFPDLTDELWPVAWAVAGAAAVRMYMPERATDDLGVLIASDDAAGARRLLYAAGAASPGDRSIGGSSWILADGARVGVLECGEPWCVHALAGARDNRDAEGLPILPLPIWC